MYLSNEAWLRTLVITFSRRQDVAFFDANKTGQLVNRLTADIQEFKSSFKLVISQVREEISSPLKKKPNVLLSCRGSVRKRFTCVC